MGSKQIGVGLYEFLIESELQHYYNAIKNDLKVQSVSQLKYVTDDDLNQIGMARPEIRRLKKFFQKHCPQTYLAKMKKKLLYRREDAISVASLSNYAQNAPGRMTKSVTPGRHIIQAESIVIHKTLGSGEFGTVQQGVWTSDDGQRIQVAIKCLSQERMENNPVDFLKEAAMMHNVDHEHIVRLYGVVLDTSALMLVTELAPLRSLLECLKEPSMRRNLSVPTLYDFAIQICDGMQYLESKRLIHRDLAARNILVFSRSKVKISDFGLSRALGVGKDYYQTNFNVNLKLPIAWCAPECINFLRFTSASDVWAYGVTLWEMFSYGFQPWAALTGQQILEAIDEPNYQRLERPECCPNEIYCQIMLKTWQHDPLSRPTFAQLSNLILECKPEQVQAIRESDAKPRREFLIYDVGDIITVLEKKSQQNSDDVILWKGVLKDGKSGLFHPVNTITYLGSSLPSVKQSQSPFHRNDSRSSSMRKGRISADMISGPQGDLKHTGHVGPDGQFFGDITFLGSKCWVPRQVVPPYKPESSPSEQGLSSSSSRAAPQSSSRSIKESTSEISSSDTVPLLSLMGTDDGSNKGSTSSSSGLRRKPMLVSIPGSNYNSGQTDHEYHEISDEENDIMGAMGGCREGGIGVSNPALSSKSQSPLDSPRFDNHFDLETGPSLIDEVFSALQQEDVHAQPDEAHNVKNELREMARSKKKFASVKPISSSDRRTLDHAIAIANELASRSMLDLDRSGKNANSFDDLSSPRTPTSPSHRRKFSFMLGSSKSDRERRNYSQEAASIPDIQSTLTDEAKEAYNSLVEKPSMNTLGFLTPSFENKSMSFNFPEKCVSKKSDFFEPDHSMMSVQNGPQSLLEMSPKSNNLVAASNITSFPGKSHSRSLSKSDAEEVGPPPTSLISRTNSSHTTDDEEVDGNPLRLLRQNKLTNVLPLPPKKGTQPASTTRHQRKHPLLIPNRISTLAATSSSLSTKEAATPSTSTSGATPTAKASPPAPPPKPVRQGLASLQVLKDVPEQNEGEVSPKKLGIEKGGKRVVSSASATSSSEVVASSNNANNKSSGPLENNKINGSEISPLEGITNESFMDSTLQEIKNRLSDLSVSSSVVSNSVEPKRRSRDSVLLYENVEQRGVVVNNNNKSAGSEQENIVPNVNRLSVSASNSNTNNNVVESSNTTANNEDCPTVQEDAPLLPSSSSSSSRPSSESSFSFNNNSSHSRLSSSSSLIPNNSSSSRLSQSSLMEPFQNNPAFKSDEAFLTPTTSPSVVSETAYQSRVTKVKESSPTLVVAEPVPKPRSMIGNSTKIKTLQRILGPSASEQDCAWALVATDSDAAHAVKLLRLKSLLPDSFITSDASNLVSVLEMSHWDVARASDFLLNNSTGAGKVSSSVSHSRGKLRTPDSFSFETRSDQINNNNNSNSSSETSSTSNNSTSSGEGSSSSSSSHRSYIRPTHV